MTYTVSGGMLNPTRSLKLTHCCDLMLSESYNGEKALMVLFIKVINKNH